MNKKIAFSFTIGFDMEGIAASELVDEAMRRMEELGFNVHRPVFPEKDNFIAIFPNNLKESSNLVTNHG